MNNTSDRHHIYTNAVDVIPREELDRRLKSGATLRVKLGIDPTAPDIHLGFVVVLKKLREFQDLGHTAVLVIGDYTARVGDPSGRSKTRPILSPETIEENTKTYLDQAHLILDRDRTEVRHNSEWLAPLTMADIIVLTRAVTVARILERDDFTKRYASGDPITLTELLYPLMQAYDSVVLRADVETERGTGRRANVPGHQIAGKTGTSQNNHSVAFVGSTPEYTASVMVLNPDEAEDVGGFGGDKPAQTWHDAMAPVLADREPASFGRADPRYLGRLARSTGSGCSFQVVGMRLPC